MSFRSEWQVVGLMKYKRQVQAVEKILPELCPKCKKLVENALGYK